MRLESAKSCEHVDGVVQRGVMVIKLLSCYTKGHTCNPVMRYEKPPPHTQAQLQPDLEHDLGAQQGALPKAQFEQLQGAQIPIAVVVDLGQQPLPEHAPEAVWGIEVWSRAAKVRWAETIENL